MTLKTRRQALGTVLLMGAGFGTALACGGWAAPAHASARVTIPAGPMRLTRRLERSLGGAETLSVERSWHVEFARQPRGIALTGKQVEALVEAPGSLSSLATIEQSRVTDDMWPIMLSNEGKIMAAGTGTRTTDLNAAVEAANRLIAERNLPADVQTSIASHLSDMQRASGQLLDRLPDDLFFPVLGPQVTRRALDLPGGMTGEFEVHYEASASEGNDWLDCAERLITTRIGATERRARECWVLAEIGV